MTKRKMQRRQVMGHHDEALSESKVVELNTKEEDENHYSRNTGVLGMPKQSEKEAEVEATPSDRGATTTIYLFNE